MRTIILSRNGLRKTKILLSHLNYCDYHDHNNGFDDEHGSGSVPVEEECPPLLHFGGYLDENYDVILIIVMTIILSD